MKGNELLRKLGEETMYSAKGHFKACDIRRNSVTATMWGGLVLNILGMADLCPGLNQWIAGLGLFGAVGLLIWNEGEDKDYRANHKKYGEEYLSLHKKIRGCYFLGEPKEDEIRALNAKVAELDKIPKPEIPLMARKWAKNAIEKYGETDNWFLN